MFVGRKIFYLLTVFLILTVTSNAQSAWLQRSWRGRAYILGNNTQNYDILLMINKVETPEPDTATVAQNTKPLPDTIATPQQEKSLTTERIPVLPAGNIVSVNQNHALPLLQNPPVLLHKTLSMIIPQNEPAPQL